jgi:molybdopterin converting factor subunit 1
MFGEVGSQTRWVEYAVWMRVRVLYFGVLKDVFSRASEDVLLAEGASVADLLEVVRGPEDFWDSIAVAVNQEYAKAEDLLKEGDEVALLPPVSGGVSWLEENRQKRCVASNES